MRLLIPLFSPGTATYGGVTRAIAIAEAASAAGHQVAFCASGPVLCRSEKGPRFPPEKGPRLDW